MKKSEMRRWGRSRHWQRPGCRQILQDLTSKETSGGAVGGGEDVWPAHAECKASRLVGSRKSLCLVWQAHVTQSLSVRCGLGGERRPHQRKEHEGRSSERK
ncbi:uncharacterized protein LOC144338519 [Macaca mulatta]